MKEKMLEHMKVLHESMKSAIEKEGSILPFVVAFVNRGKEGKGRMIIPCPFKNDREKKRVQESVAAMLRVLVSKGELDFFLFVSDVYFAEPQEPVTDIKQLVGPVRDRFDSREALMTIGHCREGRVLTLQPYITAPSLEGKKREYIWDKMSVHDNGLTVVKDLWSSVFFADQTNN